MTTRAVIYARYSSENQRDASIEDQVRTSKAWIGQKAWTCVEVYADHAISGATRLRPNDQINSPYRCVSCNKRHSATVLGYVRFLDLEVRFTLDSRHLWARSAETDFDPTRL